MIKQPIADCKTKLRVLLPCDSYLFTRLVNNMPKGTKYKITGTIVFEGIEWQVLEFYKDKKSE